MNLQKYAVLAVVAILLCIATYAAIVIWLTWPVSELSISKAGAFGDTFGLTNTLFSGLAFAGIVITILHQRQELTESREIFRIQRFEGSFYRLLDLYRENLASIRIVDKDSIYVGIDALNHTCKRLNCTMQKYTGFLENEEKRPLYEVQLFIEVQKQLTRQARYLGTLQAILELISRDLRNDIEREPYWDIVASQITSAEAKYIFYCCLVSMKNDKLRDLMHSSGLIKFRVRYSNLSTTHRELYQRIHGVEIIKAPTTLVMPHDRNEMKLLRKKLKAAARARV
ncbi:putative phage abortive infection protein [Aeromonas veronii]|uniref:putative phage abortive infection protein n=1 Tax=Aeromonas veronii TaxID=654 RepID=UPI003D1A4525